MISRIGTKTNVAEAGRVDTGAPVVPGLTVPFPARILALPNLRKSFAYGMILLTLASGPNAALAANLGANRPTSDGAKIEQTIEAPGPAAERFAAARPHMEALLDAREQHRRAKFDLEYDQRALGYLRKDIAETEADLAAWRLPDTTGLDKWDAELAVEDAENERAGFERELERFGTVRTELEEKIEAGIVRLGETETAVDQKQAAVVTFASEARAELRDRGLALPLDHEPDLFVIGLAVIVERWEAETGRAVSSMRVDEQAWLATVAAAHPNAIDDAVTRLGQVGTAMLNDAVSLALADTPTPLGRERAQIVADTLDVVPRALDMELLDALDESQFTRMLDRAARLQAVGLTWTTNLRSTKFNSGPSALTDFVALRSLSHEGEMRFWIDPPAAMAARSVVVDFDALLAEAQRWVDAGRSLTADAVPVVAILAAGGERAERVNALLSRVDLSGHPKELESLANLATGRFGGSGIDAAALAVFDAASEALGRKLTMGEIATLADRHFSDQPMPYTAQAIATAQANDPQASFDDLYVWSIAEPMSRQVLIESIEERIGDGVSRADRAAEYSERFADHVDTLTNSDLMRIDWLLDAFEDASVRAAVGKQIGADLANEGSELGGIFVDGPEFVPLASNHAASNNQFIFPSDRDPLQGVVTVHLHAVRAEGNEKSAGPSSAFGGRTADRGHAAESGKSDLVITHLGDGKFGADYYTPEGAVVDLGTFTY